MLVSSIFSSSPNVFYPSQTNFNFSVTFAFNLEQSENLSSGEGLIAHFIKSEEEYNLYTRETLERQETVIEKLRNGAFKIFKPLPNDKIFRPV